MRCYCGFFYTVKSVYLVCVSRIKVKLEESNKDRVKPFMAGVQEEVKKILSNIKDYQVTAQLWPATKSITKAQVTTAYATCL